MPNRVTGTGSYLPEKVLTNDDLSRMVDTSDAWIVERTGIRERHILDPSQAASDLAAAAGREACRKAGVDPSAVDCIIVGTVTGDEPEPSPIIAGGFRRAADLREIEPIPLTAIRGHLPTSKLRFGCFELNGESADAIGKLVSA